MMIGTGTANADFPEQDSGGQSPAVPGLLSSVTSIATERSDPAGIRANPHGHGLASIASPRNQTAVSVPLQGSWDPTIFKTGKTGYPAIAGFNFSGEKYRIQPTQVPGTGISKPDCDTWVRTLKSGDEVREIMHKCDTLGCPKCVDSAITKKARKAAEHFDHYENAKLQENAALVPGEYRRATPRHIVFTISPAHIAELWARAGKNHGVFLDMARAEYNEILKGCALVGGVTVYHGNRVRHPDTGLTGKEAKALLVREAMCRGNMKDDSPAAELYSHIRKQKNWADYYYFAPHFHFTGYGKVPDLDEFEEMFPGWRYHNKGNVPNVGGLLRYLFSHMAMIEDRQVVTWTGRMSRAVLGVEELRTTEHPVICEKTGLPWVIIDSLDKSEIGRTYTEPVTEYRSFFRCRKIRKNRAPGALVFPKQGKRSMAPPDVHERGILAIARYCDEWGRL